MNRDRSKLQFVEFWIFFLFFFLPGAFIYTSIKIWNDNNNVRRRIVHLIQISFREFYFE